MGNFATIWNVSNIAQWNDAGFCTFNMTKQKQINLWHSWPPSSPPPWAGSSCPPSRAKLYSDTFPGQLGFCLKTIHDITSIIHYWGGGALNTIISIKIDYSCNRFPFFCDMNLNATSRLKASHSCNIFTKIPNSFRNWCTIVANFGTLFSSTFGSWAEIRWFSKFWQWHLLYMDNRIREHTWAELCQAQYIGR